MDQRILVLALLVSNGDPLPGGDLLEIFHELASPTAKSDELDSLLIELGEVFVGRELGVEDESRLYTASHPLPERKEGEHLVVGLLFLDVCRGIEQEFRLSILSKEGECPLHDPSLAPAQWLLEH